MLFIMSYSSLWHTTFYNILKHKASFLSSLPSHIDKKIMNHTRVGLRSDGGYEQFDKRWRRQKRHTMAPTKKAYDGADKKKAYDGADKKRHTMAPSAAAAGPAVFLFFFCSYKIRMSFYFCLLCCSGRYVPSLRLYLLPTKP